MSEEQIYRLYEQALELSPAARPAFLAQACRDDANARREIESLLAAAERDSTAGFMNTPALEKYADVFASPLGDKPMLLNGRYYIPNPNQPLGEGGFGKVYVAYDQRLHDRRVIVKTLKLTPNANINEYIRRKFFGDIDALTRFRHQYIVNILDQGALPDSGEPFFVMDLIEGRSLRDVMRREHLETGRIACIIQQTSYAITYAHELGVIHRDLKPDNIMLRDSDDSVVVIDFGIATVQEWKREQRRGDSPKKTLLVGTAEYMAPEQIRGLPEVASDIWALDVISFELLTGQLPFAVPRDEKTGQVQWQQLSALHLAGVRVKPADLRPYLPDAAQSALLKSLAFAPAERHAQARDFGDALFAALTTAPQPASAPTEIISYSTIAATEELPSPQAANQVAAPTHPAQSWASLRDYARHTPRIQPELANANDAQRGMGARPGSPPNRFRQGDQLRLVIDSDWEGHLFLLDEGPEGIIYCLCPSHFAPDTRLRRERCVLPQAGARYDAFELGGGQPGREHLLAIVSDEPLGLDWLPRDAQEPARVLNQANIEMLLARLRALDAACWMAFATHFEIVA